MAPYTPIAAAAGDSWQVGDIRDLPHDTVPEKWLECLGQSLLRADYPDLFTAIGTKWGSADGTHFNLPDFQRQTVVGRSSAAGSPSMCVVGSGGGAETASLEVCHLPAHNHAITPTKAVCALASCGACVGCCTSFVTGGTCATPASACTGAGCAHDNMPPWKVVRKIIRALP